MLTTITKEKKRRGFASLVNQFSDVKTINENLVVQSIVEPPAISLSERLNRMIAAGAFFDVTTDDFQIVGTGNLTEAEKAFLTANRDFVLCTLQQALLTKYVRLDYILHFKDEISEQTAILTDGGTNEPPFEVVRDITKIWFENLLEDISKVEMGNGDDSK